MKKFENWEIFEDIATIKITKTIKEQLEIYFEFLNSENEKYNLTTITNLDEVYRKHFFDSLTFCSKLELNNQKLCDLGTGAGFPGVVIKIFFPDVEVHLVESNNKKISFLNQLISKLNLKEIYTHSQRAEIFAISKKEQFDIVISRAVSELNILLELGAQLLKINGYFVCLKGPKIDWELQNLNNQNYKLGLELRDRQNLDDKIIGVRVNLFYQKLRKTPEIYPRQYAQIKKKPLGK
ncbi:16S rRNA methyltransferase GidB [Spiroplasma sabaudiense Ar-1343]|uniref:Ribosomal RNA small subunit methyltransferase G n=1 Tax=Spiroplasma sabaudiense Ar-1343 TaxID=1276257 RepID=W6ABM7_9MOLU|nr:16S rRNA (guanine(527)-N(7))-methyltransferase RsmG [Spiroplasma sabaudiense]AHI54230.1 16S rRNA methyltransferase GidB [Spiroplasma sabaudiense Ar-1343]